ncbi:MAG: hypothetical protein ACR2M4_10565 [Actinomycetota bacterium]
MVAIVETYDSKFQELIAKRVRTLPIVRQGRLSISFAWKSKARSPTFHVRTYQEGLALRLSSVEGAVASAATLLHLGGATSDQLRICNLGGPIDVTLEQTEDGLLWTQSGNATYIFGTEIELGSILKPKLAAFNRVLFQEEIAAYSVSHQNFTRELAVTDALGG